MRRIAGSIVLALAMAAVIPIPASGQAEADTTAVQEPPVTMHMVSRVQVRYSYLDRDEQPAAGSFGIRRARLALSGTAYRRFDYGVQVGLAGEGARLLDAHIRYRILPMATLWFGQGKTAFGRQQITSSGSLQMVDRAITDGRFAAGRQQGLALMGQNAGRTFEYSAGIYNGNGINAANPNTRYMTVGRVVWTPFGAYPPAESALDYPDRPRLAIGVAGVRNTVGPEEAEVDIRRLGAEAAFKLQGLSAVGELYREREGPSVGEALRTSGWYVQAGYLLPGRRHELAARYAVIHPDSPIDMDVIERGVGHSLYLSGHRAKLQTDLRTVDRRAADISDVELRVQFQLTL